MAIVNYFYNETTRKYVALFGTYFNQLTIERRDNSGAEVQSMIVPISYAPWQKILSKVTQDPNLDRKSAITLPRMSFEINGMTFDGTRKISPTMKIRKNLVDDTAGGRNFVWAGTPYNLEFSLYIMAKYSEDATKIMEQIIPFFSPDFTSTVRIVDNLDPIDIPLILNGVTSEEIYEGSYEERRSILWTLNFTMKAWYFGPERKKKVIKFVDTRMYSDTEGNPDHEETYTVQPGLTANGEPTTDIEDTIDYANINFDDNWAVITQITRPGET